MGYTKIVQSGDVIEVYEYDKEVHYVPRQTNNSRRNVRNRQRNPNLSFRRNSSFKRAKKAFYRLVASNLQTKEIPAFITLTTFEETSITRAYLYLRYFTKNLKYYFGKDIIYVSVPEWQAKSGFIHFHTIIWGIPKEHQGKKLERTRRLFQNMWLRGYCDVRPCNDSSLAIAGYMAKYMAKAMQDKRLNNVRAYSSSYNVLRPSTAGGNTISSYLSEVIPQDATLDHVAIYDTIYLGRCHYKRVIKKQ